MKFYPQKSNSKKLKEVNNMGHQSNVKMLRGQVRIAVKELMGEVLNAELAQEINKDITLKVETRLDRIQEHLTSTLAQIDERSKEVAAYVVRNTVPAEGFKPTETTEIPTEPTGQ